MIGSLARAFDDTIQKERPLFFAKMGCSIHQDQQSIRVPVPRRPLKSTVLVFNRSRDCRVVNVVKGLQSTVSQVPNLRRRTITSNKYIA